MFFFLVLNVNFVDISKRLHEDEPFFSWRVPKWLNYFNWALENLSNTFAATFNFTWKKCVCNSLHCHKWPTWGRGFEDFFLEPCMDYKIYCGLKYASYLHYILAPKSWQGIRLHPRFWEFGIHSSAVWFEMKDPCPDQPEIQLY